MKVDEPRFVREMEEESRKYGLETEETDGEQGSRKLSAAERKSLLLILASVVFWFMGYNAVTSKYSVYAGKVLAQDYNSTLMIANVAAIIPGTAAGRAERRPGG